jgi:hypothetical protein
VSGAPKAAKSVEQGQLMTKVEGLLEHQTWCRLSHAPVGFVLSFLHFENHEFRIDNKYVRDTIVKVPCHGQGAKGGLKRNPSGVRKAA